MTWVEFYRVIGKSSCIAGVWVFLFELRPRFVVLAGFLLARRKSGWGICVSSWFLVSVCGSFLIALYGRPLCLAVSIRLPAHPNVRTEPQSVIGQT